MKGLGGLLITFLVLCTTSFAHYVGGDKDWDNLSCTVENQNDGNVFVEHYFQRLQSAKAYLELYEEISGQ